MSSKIKDLQTQEEWILLTLANASHQVKMYLENIEYLRKQYDTTAYDEKLDKFYKYFSFYRHDLIPAIKEVTELEMKHIQLIEKNPDPVFKPILRELEMHRKLSHSFFRRLEDLHQELKKTHVEIKKNCPER